MSSRLENRWETFCFIFWGVRVVIFLYLPVYVFRWTFHVIFCPREHMTLTQSCFSAGQASTLIQHWDNVDVDCCKLGGGPRVVVSTAAFHARVRGSVPGLGGLKETKLFLPHPRVKVSIVGGLRDREVACSASDRQGSNPVSGGQCHLNHLIILRRFSWPSLAYKCKKVA